MAGLRSGVRVAVTLVLLCATSCSRHDRRLEQHQDAFISLSASTAAVADAWLAGSVSGTYAATALDRMFAMVEQERTSLNSSPALIADDRGAALSDSSSQLSRRIAVMIDAVRGAHGGPVRLQRSQLPFRDGS